MLVGVRVFGCPGEGRGRRSAGGDGRQKEGRAQSQVRVCSWLEDTQIGGGSMHAQQRLNDKKGEGKTSDQVLMW